jgi:lysophospholipase L1-like esterase
MRITALVLGVLFAALGSAACGSGSTAPTPIVQPPVEPPTPPPAPAPPPVLAITRVLAFGDSMTEGTTSVALPSAALTAGKTESYPYKLQALLTERYTTQSVVVLNAGVAGRLATTDRSRFNDALAEAGPELVLLMEGANDLNAPGVNNDTVTAAVNAMEDMVRDAWFRGAFVMLATLPPQRAGGPKAAPRDLLTRYNAGLRTMAAKKGAQLVQLVDVNAQFSLELIGQDGLHPTEAGYQRLAEIFLDAIKSKYETSSAVGQ